MSKGLAKVESPGRSQERRAVGRTIPKPEYELRVEFKCSSGDVIRGDVEDMSSGGIGVMFKRDAVSAVALGESTTLLLTATILKKPMEIRAELVSRTDTETSRRYAFKFKEELLLSDPKPDRLFNRRGAYRVAPGKDETIDVSLQLSGVDSSQERHVARCTDISATGIGLEISVGTDEAFKDVDLVELSISMPNSSATLTLCAWIVNRRLGEGGAVRYGLRFDEEKTKNFASQQDAITTYVLRRQQEELQDLSHI